jgi:uncharacterized protein
MSITEKLANPAPLGLLGFGLTTVLLNLHNSGLFGLNSMILAMGIAYGGIAQIIVGIMEFRKGNTFGTVAFTSYGLFWWSLVALIILPSIPGLGILAADHTSLAAYFLMWGIFTLAMFFGTLKANRGLQFVFMSLAILFFMLTTRELLGGTVIWFNTITGIEGVICGGSAVYLGLAEVLNEANGKTVLPICPIKAK